MHVFLFDIDGTLIDSGGAGRAALESAATEQFELAEPAKVNITGRSDRSIADDLFAAHGLEHTVENWDRFNNAYLKWLADHLPRRQGRILPGVPELLAQLSRRTDVALGLLTGNVRDGARLKLEFYGLQQFFAFGGFGDEHLDRNQVAEEALRAAQHHVGDRFVANQVHVIGDTPLDVRCARWIGARAIAVATGTHSAADLAACQPDVLLPNLLEFEPL